MRHRSTCCKLCRDAGVAIQLPIHNFVNDQDIVPYLMDPAEIKPVLEAVQPVLPSSLQRILNQEAQVSGSFVSVGNTCLMLGDHIKVLTRNRLEQNAVSTQLFKQVAASINTPAAQDLVMMHVVHDHLPSGYSAKLQDAVMYCVPILFMGGTLDSYEAVRMKRMSVGKAAFFISHLLLYQTGALLFAYIGLLLYQQYDRAVQQAPWMS